MKTARDLAVAAIDSLEEEVLGLNSKVYDLQDEIKSLTEDRDEWKRIAKDLEAKLETAKP